MKICLYSPYIPKHTGGGEKYLFDVASTLAKKHQVSLAVPQQYAGDAEIVKKYEQFLNRSLDDISFIPTPLGSQENFFKKLWWTKQFDVFYYLTDGSLFFSLAKKNILHIQFPLKLDKSSLFEQLKLKNWRIKNTNSEFTKQVVEESWPTQIDVVHHPLVDVNEIGHFLKDKKIKKEKIILSVGRFFRHLHSKRQDVLVDLFRKLLKKYPQQTKGWKLVLIGSVEDQEYLTRIKRKKGQLPIEFYHDLPRKKLLKWYAKSSIYWHSAGFEADIVTHPEKAEHFGMSTLEAMAAKAVPVVYKAGGPIEVVGEKNTQLLWRTREECLATTIDLIMQPKLLKKYNTQLVSQVNKFSKHNFEKKLWEMLSL